MKTRRLAHIGASFAIVVAVYAVYALLAVPWIEPPAVADERRAGDGGGPPIARRPDDEVDPRVKELVGLFPPGSWELRNPIIIDIDQARLLMERYQNLGDGGVEIYPCTMIYTPDPNVSDQAERNRQAVVLEVPDGALLRFDQPFDPRKATKIGRLVGGELHGRVTIRSQGKIAGPEDDLHLETRDVQLAERVVSTPHAVDFRWGPHYGMGQQMRMKLAPREDGGGERAGADFGGLESFELQSVKCLHLDLSKAKLAAAQPPAAGPPPGRAAPPALGSGPAGPVEVTCRGPFRFLMAQQMATFQDQVDVLRVRPDGPSDRLSCELLTIFFTKAPKPAAAEPPAKTAAAKGPAGKDLAKPPPARQRPSSFDLQPQRIEARGNPAEFTSTADNAYARGERLEYDLLLGRFILESSGEAVLRQGPQEIHARGVQYDSAAPGRIGQVLARGPGWLRGQMVQRPGAAEQRPGSLPQRPNQHLEARWNGQLQVRPQEQHQVISLTGGAGLNAPGMGQLDAQEIHFWLLEAAGPLAPGQQRYQPHRLLARGNVRANSPQLSSVNEQMEVWFEPPAQVLPAGRGAEGWMAGTDEARPQRAGPLVRPAAARPVATDGAAGPLPPPRPQHLEIFGRLLRARVVLGQQQQQGELAELTVEGGVRFTETQTAQPGERPMLITGETLHVADANQPHTSAVVAGKPAHFEARGLALTGAVINLNRGTNRLWIDGPGRMDAPLDKDLEGRQLRKTGTLRVDWQGKMAFDGRTAHFEETVVAHGPSQQLRTENLDVQFQQMVQFSDPKLNQQPQVEQILCRGGVYVENHSLDPQQQVVSHERMEFVDLAINLKNGASMASGPGWLTSVRRGSGDPLQSRFAPGAGGARIRPPLPPGEGRGEGAPPIRLPPAIPAATRSGSNPDQLTCLHIRFQGRITGNVLRRECTFHEQVRAVYAPVDSWSATPPSDTAKVLAARGIVLQCDALSVADMTPPGAPVRAVELLAAGNVVVEGAMPDGNAFTARATRMSYSEGKDLLVLEGDGRTDAELFRQQGPGFPASRAAAQKILFWPKTNRVKVEGVRSLEINQLPGQRINGPDAINRINTLGAPGGR